MCSWNGIIFSMINNLYIEWKIISPPIEWEIGKHKKRETLIFTNIQSVYKFWIKLILYIYYRGNNEKIHFHVI